MCTLRASKENRILTKRNLKQGTGNRGVRKAEKANVGEEAQRWATREPPPPRVGGSWKEMSFPNPGSQDPQQEPKP